jgi:hypothetical protein
MSISVCLCCIKKQNVASLHMKFNCCYNQSVARNEKYLTENIIYRIFHNLINEESQTKYGRKLSD